MKKLLIGLFLILFTIFTNVTFVYDLIHCNMMDQTIKHVRSSKVVKTCCQVSTEKTSGIAYSRIPCCSISVQTKSIDSFFSPSTSHKVNLFPSTVQINNITFRDSPSTQLDYSSFLSSNSSFFYQHNLPLLI